VQPLTDFMWTGLHAGQKLDHQMERLANIFYNLKTGLGKLKEKYKAQAKKNEVQLPFPFLTSYTPFRTPSSMGFVYKERLHNGDGRQTTAIFKAEDMTGKQLFIKFTSRYHEYAHELLSKSGYAPQIYGLETLPCGTLMVIMEYIDGRTMSGRRFSSNDLDRVRKAKESLHEQNIVFGDLRPNNIINPQNGAGVLLVDFDWCGQDGKARYPASLNGDRKCGWHKDVKGGAIMKKAHDDHLFNLFVEDTFAVE